MTFHILIQLLRGLWHLSISLLDHSMWKRSQICKLQHCQCALVWYSPCMLHSGSFSISTMTLLRGFLEDLTALSFWCRAYILITALTTPVCLFTTVNYVRHIGFLRARTAAAFKIFLPKGWYIRLLNTCQKESSGTFSECYHSIKYIMLI